MGLWVRGLEGVVSTALAGPLPPVFPLSDEDMGRFIRSDPHVIVKQNGVTGTDVGVDSRTNDDAVRSSTFVGDRERGPRVAREMGIDMRAVVAKLVHPTASDLQLPTVFFGPGHILGQSESGRPFDGEHVLLTEGQGAGAACFRVARQLNEGHLH